MHIVSYIIVYVIIIIVTTITILYVRVGRPQPKEKVLRSDSVRHLHKQN